MPALVRRLAVQSAQADFVPFQRRFQPLRPDAGPPGRMPVRSIHPLPRSLRERVARNERGEGPPAQYTSTAPTSGCAVPWLAVISTYPTLVPVKVAWRLLLVTVLTVPP
jgi:hypothetical protein